MWKKIYHFTDEREFQRRQEPPQIIGDGEYTLVYYDPEDEIDGADKDES